MEQIVGKTKVKKQFLRNLTIGNTKTTKKSLIAKNFKDFFLNIGPHLASVIPNGTKTVINTVLNGKELTYKEFLDAF